MKKTVKKLGIAVLAAMLVFAFVGCEEPEADEPPPPPPLPPPSPVVPTPSGTTINIAAIEGVIVPAYTLTPVKIITENDQYSGTVTWNDNPSTFLANKQYTATITLTPKEDYTLKGITANFFKVAGAETRNDANSGVITAVFPMTDSRLVNSIVIKTQPTNLTYTHGDTLDLTGLVVTLNYSTGQSEEVDYEYFPIKSITTSPDHGIILDNSTHNRQPVKITYGSKFCNTGNLIININPVYTDFNISGTGTFTYDGKPKTVTITPKEGKSTGNIIVKYNDSTTAPSAVGYYDVTFDISAATGYNAASGFYAGRLWISNVTPTAADFNISGTGTFNCNGSSKIVTIIPKEGKSTGNITVKYNGSTIAPSAVGTYTVTFDVATSTNFNSASGLSAGTITIDAIFENIAALKTYLDSKPANNTSNPYNVALNVSDLGGEANNSGSIGNALINNKNKYVSLDLLGSTITKIPDNAFRTWFGCTSLTNITIPDSVTSIGEFAFLDCTSLTNVTIPNSVTSIGSSAFRGCTKFTNVTIPNSVTSIGSSAFGGCTSLVSVTIGSGVIKMEENDNSYLNNFNGCTSLTAINVDIGNSNYSSEQGVLYNKNKTILIVCPEGKTGFFTIPNSVTSIESSAFLDCNKLTSITIPNSVTSIGYFAFYGCTSLTNITIPSSVTSIGSRAFSRCTSFTSITIPDSVTSIGWLGIFQDCTGLISVTIGNSVTRINEYDFSGCTKLTNVIIPNSVTIIRERAFSGCSSLTSITIPNSVTDIDYSAFNDCASLTSITIPNSVRNLQGNAFNGCTNLITVKFEQTGFLILGTTFWGGVVGGSWFESPFLGDLQDRYLEGGIGTYTTTAPVSSTSVWTKQ